MLTQPRQVKEHTLIWPGRITKLSRDFLAMHSAAKPYDLTSESSKSGRIGDPEIPS